MSSSQRVIITTVENSDLGTLLASIDTFLQQTIQKSAIHTNLLSLTNTIQQYYQRLKNAEGVYSALQQACQIHQANTIKMPEDKSIYLAASLYKVVTSNFTDVVAHANYIETNKDKLKLFAVSPELAVIANKISQDIQQLPATEKTKFDTIIKNLSDIVPMLAKKDQDVRSLRIASTTLYNTCQTSHALLTEKIQANLPKNISTTVGKFAGSTIEPQTRSPKDGTSSDEDSNSDSADESPRHSSGFVV